MDPCGSESGITAQGLNPFESRGLVGMGPGSLIPTDSGRCYIWNTLRSSALILVGCVPWLTTRFQRQPFVCVLVSCTCFPLFPVSPEVASGALRAHSTRRPASLSSLSTAARRVRRTRPAHPSRSIGPGRRGGGQGGTGGQVRSMGGVEPSSSSRVSETRESFRVCFRFHGRIGDSAERTVYARAEPHMQKPTAVRIPASYIARE